MKKILYAALALSALASSCKKKVVEAKKGAVASMPDTTDAKGWSGLRDQIDPTSWQATDIK